MIALKLKRYQYVKAIATLVVTSALFASLQSTANQNVSHEKEAYTKATPHNTARTIQKIIVHGNRYVSREAILQRSPYKVGDLFNPLASRELIKNLFEGIQRFKTITLKGENVDDDGINLHIIVQEKKPLKDVVFDGNKQVSTKDLKEKTGLNEVAAIDEQELQRYTQVIKKLYLEKGFHRVSIATDLQLQDDQAIAVFTIKEYPKSTVKRIRFTGNKHVTGKELRNAIFTREEWVLSFLDKSGSYNPERLEGDKYLIEKYYQDRGFLHAKVIDAKADVNEQKNAVFLTFDIQEGAQYRIKDIKAPGNEHLTEEYILSQLPIRPGQVYSKQRIMDTIKRLEWIWGEYGYIFAHIEPSILPDEDNKTVSLAFHSDLGNKVRLNKITIKGNQKTRDKIIRRKILLNEGDILTNFKMDRSKDLVTGMGYFDQKDGVNWKTTRLAEDLADLDLMLQEAKTGHFNLKFGFGGAGIDAKSPSSGFSVGGQLNDTNLFGSGIALNVDGSWSKDEQNIMLHVADPWLFDKPLLGAFDVYHRRPTYDEFRNISPISEKLTGAALTAGVVARTKWFDDMQLLFSVGIDNVRHEKEIQMRIPEITLEQKAYKEITCKEFPTGSYAWITNKIEQDTRNHPIHPSRGQKWALASRVGIPSFNDKLGFYRISFDGNWLTPLIGENDLVLRLHGHFGYASPMKNRSIPFSELFHVGGPNSVRGFLYGQIGPHLLDDSIGAKKAFYLNTELIFPITPDFNMKGVLFYDGGAGWDAPYADCFEKHIITHNSFNYRHSVGVGIRILNPMPARIDWGFKLDPRKDRFDPNQSESASEVHLTMSYDW